jgi:hypothetical protein
LKKGLGYARSIVTRLIAGNASVRMSAVNRCLVEVVGGACIMGALLHQPGSAANTPPAALARQQGLSDEAVRAEVIGNISRQAVGPYSVANLNIPDDFLRREADRIIRASFEEQFRIVVRDVAATTEDAHQPWPAGEPTATRPASTRVGGAIRLHEPTLAADVLAYRRSFTIGRPANRGFIPKVRDKSITSHRWSIDPPTAATLARRAADEVAQRLAVDGLLPTLAQAIAIIGPAAFTEVDQSDLHALGEVGLPVDLLCHFVLPDGTSGSQIVSNIATRLAAGQVVGGLANDLRAATFRFRPTCPGFRAASESGEVHPRAVRAQMTRAAYWKGQGDGGNADILRQAVEALPNCQFVVSIELEHARGFIECASAWPLQQTGQLTIVPEPLPVAQWAQDNGKPGAIETDDGQRRLAILAPRYASWGDDGSAFVPGETFLLSAACEALEAELVHSPLLFQGGNTLCVTHPASNERLLLVGDADVWRNTALGLTRDQTLQALAAEFGADRCAMLREVSFHLDYDVSVRAVGDRLVALVNDPLAAATMVLQTGTNLLAQAGILNAASATQALQALDRGEHQAFLQNVAPVVFSLGPEGRFPLSLAEKFSTSPVDSGVANLQRYLLAIDLLISHDAAAAQMPASTHAGSYLRSFQRRDADRDLLHQQLRDLGMHVVAIPSTSDAMRSLTAINGIHVREMFLMPAYGGLYHALDRAAQRAIEAALGGHVRVVPILSGESQRRGGAVHCSLSIIPEVAQPRAGDP